MISFQLFCLVFYKKKIKIQRYIDTLNDKKQFINPKRFYFFLLGIPLYKLDTFNIFVSLLLLFSPYENLQSSFSSKNRSSSFGLVLSVNQSYHQIVAVKKNN